MEGPLHKYSDSVQHFRSMQWCFCLPLTIEKCVDDAERLNFDMYFQIWSAKVNKWLKETNTEASLIGWKEAQVENISHYSTTKPNSLNSPGSPNLPGLLISVSHIWILWWSLLNVIIWWRAGAVHQCGYVKVITSAPLPVHCMCSTSMCSALHVYCTSMCSIAVHV